jgi:hypothetical protein
MKDLVVRRRSGGEERVFAPSRLVRGWVGETPSQAARVKTSNAKSGPARRFKVDLTRLRIRESATLTTS